MDRQPQSYTFLVTGGGGYIGFHIGLRLLQLKHKVILFDVNYPSKKWDQNLSFPASAVSTGPIEEITCSYGILHFVMGITDSVLK